MDLVGGPQGEKGAEDLGIDHLPRESQSRGSAYLVGLGNAEVDAAVGIFLDQLSRRGGGGDIVGISKDKIQPFIRHPQ